MSDCFRKYSGDNGGPGPGHPSTHHGQGVAALGVARWGGAQDGKPQRPSKVFGMSGMVLANI